MELSYFIYDEQSPSGIVWASNRYWGANKKVIRCEAGSRAGCLNNDGYWMVWHPDLRKSFGCHRVVYEINTGVEIPEGFEVDHKDGNRANNCFSNLRLVDDKLNARNQKLNANSKTGIQGVYWQKTGNVTFAVATWIDLNGNRFRKYFSTLKLGIMEAFKQAIFCRESAILRLNEQGAGYSNRHGK